MATSYTKDDLRTARADQDSLVFRRCVRPTSGRTQASRPRSPNTFDAPALTGAMSTFKTNSILQRPQVQADTASACHARAPRTCKMNGRSDRRISTPARRYSHPTQSKMKASRRGDFRALAPTPAGRDAHDWWNEDDGTGPNDAGSARMHLDHTCMMCPNRVTTRRGN